MAMSVDVNVLDSWTALNAALLDMDEEECVELLQAERAGKNRPVFVSRINSRFNRARSIRERREMVL
jgi:hypothetical protein